MKTVQKKGNVKPVDANEIIDVIKKIIRAEESAQRRLERIWEYCESLHAGNTKNGGLSMRGNDG